MLVRISDIKCAHTHTHTRTRTHMHMTSSKLFSEMSRTLNPRKASGYINTANPFPFSMGNTLFPRFMVPDGLLTPLVASTCFDFCFHLS